MRGKRYDFHTTDGTCYSGAIYLEGDAESGFCIQWKGAMVFIAPHEFDHSTMPTKEVK